MYDIAIHFYAVNEVIARKQASVWILLVHPLFNPTMRMSRGTQLRSGSTESGSPGGSIRLVRRFVETHGERSRASGTHCVVEPERCPASRAGIRAAYHRSGAEQPQAHPHRSPLSFGRRTTELSDAGGPSRPHWQVA